MKIQHRKLSGTVLYSFLAVTGFWECTLIKQKAMMSIRHSKGDRAWNGTISFLFNHFELS